MRRYKTKSIKWKLLVSVYAMFLLLMGSVGVQILGLISSIEKVNHMDKVQFEFVEKADELKLNVVQVQQYLTDISATRAKKGYDDGFENAEKHALRAKELIEELGEINPSEENSLNNISASFEPYYAIGKEMANTYIEKGEDDGNILMAEFDQYAIDINSDLDKLKLGAQTSIGDTILGIEKSIKIRIFASVLTIIVAFALTFITRRKVIYQIINPVCDISEKLSYISKGDLNIELSYESDDEIGKLSEDIRFMVSSLNQYIDEIKNFMREMANGNFVLNTEVEFRGDFEEIKDSVEYFSQEMSRIINNISIASIQLDEGANQVSSSAQALAGGAASQNAFIEDLNLSIEKLSIKIQNSSQKTDDASKIVLNLGDEAQNSNLKMQQMIGAMNNISESSNEIGKIIKTIEDIAFQTNILALNAAVEAARAGEAGKGFAVVADEVRNLASRSAQAAKNTTSLIEESIDAVEQGVDMVNNTASSLELLSQGINNVVDIISDVSFEAIMQANEVKELETDIEQISGITQTIAATAEESSATSEELSSQSSSLKNMISKFNIK